MAYALLRPLNVVGALVHIWQCGDADVDVVSEDDLLIHLIREDDDIVCLGEISDSRKFVDRGHTSGWAIGESSAE